MDDLAAKLGELLNNPGVLDNIKNLAGMMGGNGENQNSAPTQSTEQSDSMPDTNGDTAQFISKLAPLISSFHKEDDNTRFLHALRPLLCSESQKKLDEATKLLQLMRVLPLLKNSGIF